jgi:PKD repeat protein
LGLGSASSTAPAAAWTSRAVYYTGGNYAFDGTTTACDATFFFDFSDLAKSASGTNRWFVKVADSTSSNPTSIKSFKLYVNGVPVATSSNTPLSTDAGQGYVWLDYVLNPANDPPVAGLTATPTSGNLPLVVTFDGTGSSDLNGPISSYSWNFGDGSATATGAAARHTYSSAGKYTASLTVSDSAGATNSTSIIITVVDPDVLNAPSSLSASASSRTITLKWTDNSNNETGFYIERGLKTKNGYTYTQVGQVSANLNTFIDQVSSANTYYYRVRAYNTYNQSAYSNVVSVRVR